MKIYANYLDNELDQFIGKPIWVKVFFGNPLNCWYLKSVEKLNSDEGNLVKGFLIDLFVVDRLFAINDYNCYDNDDGLELFFYDIIDLDTYHLSTPVEMLSDQDIEELLQTVIEDFTLDYFDEMRNYAEHGAGYT